MGAEIANPGRTAEIVRKHRLTFKKSLGQNFLIDPNILRKMVSCVPLAPGDGVLEIGPGIGALTEFLARKAETVVAVEIDQRLIPVLQENLAGYKGVHLIHGDILKQDLRALIEKWFPGRNVHIVGNLPYCVTTPILMKLLEKRLPVPSIVVMVQKEVAERIAAPPGGKEYGALTVACQYHAVVEYCMTVPKSVFLPRPKVDSAVIRLLLRKEPPVQVLDEALFFRVVRAAFSQRRKTLYNTMRNQFHGEGLDWQALFAEADIESGRRGETLSMEEFARLSNALSRAGVESHRLPAH